MSFFSLQAHEIHIIPALRFYDIGKKRNENLISRNEKYVQSVLLCNSILLIPTADLKRIKLNKVLDR